MGCICDINTINGRTYMNTRVRYVIIIIKSANDTRNRADIPPIKLSQPIIIPTYI